MEATSFKARAFGSGVGVANERAEGEGTLKANPEDWREGEAFTEGPKAPINMARRSRAGGPKARLAGVKGAAGPLI